MDRREFLKAASAAGCLACGVRHLAFAADGTNRPFLLTLFLRGGADGLQLVGPSADPDYVAARPPELRVQEGGEKPGLMLEHSLDARLGFGLHPEAQPLADLYKAGQLAIVHALGLVDGTRSHFVAQDMIERGVGEEKGVVSTESGWLARALEDERGRVPVYSATSSPAFALHGRLPVLSAADIGTGLSLPWGAPTADLLQILSVSGTSPAHQAGRAALDILHAVDGYLPRDASSRPLPYQPAGKARYEGAGDLVRSLTSVARLARMDLGLAGACVDHGGWDTHEGQAGRFANQVRQLSLGLAAFHEDMATAHQKCVIVVMTEFGRRLRANKSGGTDHGHGSCWLVLGEGVQGGRMYGRWPGLATPSLDQGVDLAVTTDYRTVLAESLAGIGLSRHSPFHGWKAPAALGLFHVA